MQQFAQLSLSQGYHPASSSRLSVCHNRVAQCNEHVLLGCRRHQQVQELLSRCISCRPLNRDQSLFEIPLWLADRRSTALRINLSPSFPQAAPTISVTSPLKHAKIDAAGHVTLPSLSLWNAQTSKLADVVEEAYSMVSSADDDWQLVSAASGSSMTPSLHHRDYNQRQQDLQSPSPSGQTQPSPSSSQAGQAQDFPELNAFSNEELVALLSDPDKYGRLVDKLMAKSHVAQVRLRLDTELGEQVRAQVCQDISDRANGNLEKEQLLSELRNHIAIVRSSEFAAAKEQFDGCIQRQNVVLAKLNLEVLMSKLAKAGNDADDAAEAKYDDFVAGTLPLEGFITAYSKQKNLAHCRNLKSTAAAQTLR